MLRWHGDAAICAWAVAFSSFRQSRRSNSILRVWRFLRDELRFGCEVLCSGLTDGLSWHGRELTDLPAQVSALLAEIATGINTAIDHTVSFDIDTLSGDISNIYLDGNLQPDVSTTIFSTNVNRAGFFASSNTGGTRGSFDNFTVTAVPEPSCLALLSLAGVTVVRRQRG